MKLARHLPVNKQVILVPTFTISIMLAGCSSGSDQSSSVDSTGGLAPKTENSEPPEGVNPEASTLGNPQGYVNLYELHVAQEEYVRSCMAAEGFQYIPRAVDRSLAESSLVFSENEFDEKADYDLALEQAQTYGYGQLYSLLDGTSENSATSDVDPNDEILEALPEEEGRAWAAALYGTDDGTAIGCFGEANEFTRGQDVLPPEQVEAVIELENRVFEAVAADRRMADAVAEWTGCMADGGYRFDRQDGGGEYISAEMAKIIGLELTDENSEEEIQALFQDPETRSELELLLVEEKKVATLDVTCSADIYDLEKKLYDEYFSLYSE